MPSKSEHHYALTVLSPILHGRIDRGNASHERELREELANMGVGPNSPFADLPMLHFTRFLVIDRLPDLHGAAGETLNHHYLLFLADVDGGRDDFLDAMVAAMPNEISAIWGHCAGFPEARGYSAAVRPFDFRHYIREHEVDTLFSYEAPQCRDKSVEDILRALEVQGLFADFIAKHQGAAPGVRQREFKGFVRRVEAMPLRQPGRG